MVYLYFWLPFSVAFRRSVALFTSVFQNHLYIFGHTEIPLLSRNPWHHTREQSFSSYLPFSASFRHSSICCSFTLFSGEFHGNLAYLVFCCGINLKNERNSRSQHPKNERNSRSTMCQNWTKLTFHNVFHNYCSGINVLDQPY